MSRENNWGINTLKLGLIGSSLSHSLSPTIFQLVSNLNKVNLVYLPFEVKEKNLREAVYGLKSLGFLGVNVTIPYKETVASLCDELNEDANIIEAVNTLRFADDKIYGYNTDIYGIEKSLKPYADQIVGKNFLIIGAGGAAKAAIYALIKYFNPKLIIIANRTLYRAENIADFFRKKTNFSNFKVLSLNSEEIVDSLKEVATIINCSPIGMYPHPEEIPLGANRSFTKNHIVFDMIYNPFETKLIKIAKSQGAIAFSGLTMLVAQASKAYQLWTGNIFDEKKIEKALALYLS